MIQQKVLIADQDVSYVGALVRFLMGIGKGFLVTSYTSAEYFAEEAGQYSVSLLGDGFTEIVKKDPDLCRRMGKIFHLSDGSKESEFEQIYKFQSMDTFVDRISQSTSESSLLAEEENEKQRVISIFSPMHHELTLPYSLTISSILADLGQTLFVDLEQLSILPTLIEKEQPGDLLDLLYMMESGAAKPQSVRKFLSFYEGFYFLPPMTGLSGVSSVTAGQWENFARLLRRTDFANVILVFDSILPGMESFLGRSDDILLLTKNGDFYEKSMGIFVGYLEKAGLLKNIRKVVLPMSAGNLVDGTYRMNQLMGGNLGSFARREMSQYAAAGQKYAQL